MNSIRLNCIFIITISLFVALVYSAFAQSIPNHPNSLTPVPQIPTLPDPAPTQQLAQLSRTGISKPSVLVNKIFYSLSWKMPDRYGVDRNRNGITDLPNTKSYVQNTEVCDEHEAPRFRVEFRLSYSSTYGTGGLPTWTNFPIKWKVTSSNLSEPITKDSHPANRSHKFTICLPEGRHTITGRLYREVTINGRTIGVVIDPAAAEWSSGPRPLASIDETLNVKDYFIVVIGDSFASGEGNPIKHRITHHLSVAENQRVINLLRSECPPTSGFSSKSNAELTAFIQRQLWALIAYSQPILGQKVTVWADPGSLQSKSGTLDTEHPIEDGRPGIGGYACPKLSTGVLHLTTSNLFPAPGGTIEQNHALVHRSTYAYASQYAYQLENSSDQSSVTFVNLGMSGASIPHGITDGFETIVGDQNFRVGGQIEQLRNLSHPRKIDALIISVGVNDIGFHQAVSGLIAREPIFYNRGLLLEGPKFFELSMALKNGAWHTLENELSGVYQSSLSWNSAGGFDTLEDRFKSLKAAIGSNLTYDKIYLVEYPNPGRYASSNVCFEILRAIAVRYGRKLEISQDEILWAERNILFKINNRLREFANEFGWVYVDGIEVASRPHGICTSKNEIIVGGEMPPSLGALQETDEESVRTWWRRAPESSKLQGGTLTETMGTLHPNLYGHKPIADRLSEVIELD